MTVTCARCGVRRQVNHSRDYSDLCLDCRIVERDIEDLCGTMKGHWLHLTAGEAPCDRCLEARRLQDAQKRRRKGIAPRKIPDCGTNSGYHRHRRLRELACEPCMRAHTQVTIDWKAKQRAAGRKIA